MHFFTYLFNEKDTEKERKTDFRIRSTEKGPPKLSIIKIFKQKEKKKLNRNEIIDQTYLKRE